MKQAIAHLVCTAKAVVREEDERGVCTYYACPGAQVVITDDAAGEALEERLMGKGHWARVSARTEEAAEPRLSEPHEEAVGLASTPEAE